MLKDNQESFCLLLVDFKQWIPLILLCVVLMVSGCATAPPRNPIPEEIGGSGDIYGIVDVRWWSDEAPPMIEEWMKLSPSVLKNKYSDLFGKVHNYLAISGGGADGAFGAGLLVGWTEAGTRPEFGFVTGISTGALIAPFAFLGPAYDAQLKEVYTQYSTSDLIEKRGLFKIIKNDAAAGTDGLRSLLAEYIDEKMMKALAAEYRRGRTLDIGTTNLDAARPVTWNVTRIAASGHPKALELIRQIILASASIPVAFPPVYIEIEKDGQLYDEMHVDGGATTSSGTHGWLPNGNRSNPELPPLQADLFLPLSAPRASATCFVCIRSRSETVSILTWPTFRMILKTPPQNYSIQNYSILYTWESSSTSDTEWARRVIPGKKSRPDMLWTSQDITWNILA
jgi:hypothetical protein